MLFNVAKFAMRYAGWVIIFFVIVIALGAPQTSRIHAETDLYHFFKEEHPLTISTRLVEKNLEGVSTV